MGFLITVGLACAALWFARRQVYIKRRYIVWRPTAFRFEKQTTLSVIVPDWMGQGFDKAVDPVVTDIAIEVLAPEDIQTETDTASRVPRSGVAACTTPRRSPSINTISHHDRHHARPSLAAHRINPVGQPGIQHRRAEGHQKSTVPRQRQQRSGLHRPLARCDLLRHQPAGASRFGTPRSAGAALGVAAQLVIEFAVGSVDGLVRAADRGARAMLSGFRRVLRRSRRHR